MSMATIDLTLRADATALQAVLDRMKPTVERLDAQARAANPHGPVVKLEAAFEDVFDCLAEIGLLVDGTVSEGTGGNLADLAIVPSRVLGCLCDLLTAVCDGIDAKAQAGAVVP